MKVIKVLPLINRRELREKAEQIAAELASKGFSTECISEHTIGGRIGGAVARGEIPVIVDYDTLEGDGKVVIYRSDKTVVAANFRTDISDSKGEAQRVTIDELIALMPKL